MLGYSKPPGPSISWRVHFWSAKTLSGLRLLWQPLRGPFDDVDSAYLYDIKISDGCAARRSSSTRRTPLPSWAWCGWQCFLGPKTFRAGSAISPSSRQRNTDSSWKIRNLVTWNMTKTPVNTAGCQTGKTSSLHRSTSTAENYISTRAQGCMFISAATLEIRFEPLSDARGGFMCNSVNPVLTEKPLNNMPRVIVLQDRIGRFSGLLRPTGDSICGRG